MKLTPGYYWFHCDGPDGACVLLVSVNQWYVEIVDDTNRAAQWPSPGGWLHKWRPYYIEAIMRPAPRPVTEGCAAPTQPTEDSNG